MKQKYVKELWLKKKQGIDYVEDRKNCAYLYQVRERLVLHSEEEELVHILNQQQ